MAPDQEEHPETHNESNNHSGHELSAESPDTGGEILEKLTTDAAPAVLERLAEHKYATVAMLSVLSRNHHPAVRMAVADNPNVSVTILIQLCRDENADVRYAIAENHNVPARILKRLSKDENPYVSQRARRTLQRLQPAALPPAKSVNESSGGDLQQAFLTGRVPETEKVKILVIEDNPADMRLLEKQLAEWPYELHGADRASAGLEYLSKHAVDLILLDLSLPDTAGIDTFYQVHCQVPDTPIVVLTGLEDESIGNAAVQAGAQDYLIKGQVLPGLLARSIKYAIERHQADQKLKQLNQSLERRVIQLATANQELDKLGQALSQTCEQALQASNFKSQFVSRITHDIRTPVSAVMAITDLLLQNPIAKEDKEAKELIELIKTSAESQLTLLTEILDFARVEAGKVKLEQTDFSPLRLVEDIAELFAASAAKNSISLMTYVDTELEPVLEGDPCRLREILINLTNNALKFTPSGEIVLRAIKESEKEDYVTVHFSVSDTGVGLTEENCKHLFEPFAVSNHSSQQGGSGLGLSICKHLVDLMGGEIGVESEPGNGSTFWFKIRLKRSSAPAERSNTKADAQTVERLPDGVRVLVVAAQGTTRDITHKYIKAAGWCNNGAAANAEEALTCLYQAAGRNEPYDIVIVDLESGTPDSFGLASIIQNDPRLASTALIFLTEVNQRSRGELAWSSGYSAYLTKPVKKSNLYDCITDIITNPDRTATSRTTEKVQPPVTTSTLNGSSNRILIVEDSPVTRQILAKQVEKLGAKVDTAENGAEAVEAVTQHNYALVIMDCHMPVLSGIEATRLIRARQSVVRRTPIVALTSTDSEENKQHCIEAGMDDFYTKPVSIDQLARIIARWTAIGQKQE